MVSGPITSWETDGETVETVSDFIFLGSKITADGDCSQKIKSCLLLGRKVMTNLNSSRNKYYLVIKVGQMGHCENRQKWEGPEQTRPVERMEMRREDS